ncbi:MAG: MaoC family dehydratase [Sphingomonadales bacterium]|nr:MaoC family dehydratase [Sphingomonadales bacterium]MBU3992068.1 MaoC family dehydratase [Alphaproteobacteria bacterium]
MAADLIHYEDIEVGVPDKFGRYEVTREEVIEFASKYDPQPFHLDDAAAAQTHFGRLAASGLHTAAMMMRMMVDERLCKTAGLGGSGMEEMRFIAPVYPGDTLGVVNTVLEKRRSKTRPERGIYYQVVEVVNQHGVVVMSHRGHGMIRVRHPEVPIEG